MRVVHEVVAMGSFTAAAETLSYTQSAVSRQVALMERATGGRLFTRRARGVEPTDAGAIFARRAGRILADLDAAMREVTAVADELTGTVSVGAFPTAAAVLVPMAIADLARAHPGVDVTVVEAGTPVLLQRLRSGAVDVAVLSVGHGLRTHDTSGLREELLVENDLRIAVPAAHRLAGQHRIDAEDLAGERWIVGSSRRGDPQFGAWPTLAEPNVVHAVSSWPTRLGMVAAGLGVCVIPGIAALMVLAGVRVRPVDDPHWRGRATVVVTAVDRSAEVHTVIAALKHVPIRA